MIVKQQLCCKFGGYFTIAFAEKEKKHYPACLFL